MRDTAGRPDYSQLACWAAHPDKKDLSDSIPAPLLAGTLRDTSVDVFFLHPTTLVAAKDSRWNADIDDSALNARTDNTTILFQASAFNECRLFAPRYRQAHLRSYFTTDTAAARAALDLAYEDLRAAFQYYLDHYNQGRPIIIASHSQGTTHAERLLKEFFENKPLKNRLVAAYIIGMAIPGNYFSGLAPCRDSAATGCVIGWRTFKEGYEPPYVVKENGSSWVINPLTWTMAEDPAPRDLNKGGIVTNFNHLVPRVTDARIHDGILWTHRPHFPGSILYRTQNYHIGDINLFYLNIRENVRTRILAFKTQTNTDHGSVQKGR
ncbi:MAG TPA: DUF3089 domain-containing protein [Puia sp.]|nr:DUF3089 domain-containing protein [Puia sp.]